MQKCNSSDFERSEMTFQEIPHFCKNVASLWPGTMTGNLTILKLLAVQRLNILKYFGHKLGGPLFLSVDRPLMKMSVHFDSRMSTFTRPSTLRLIYFYLIHQFALIPQRSGIPWNPNDETFNLIIFLGDWWSHFVFDANSSLAVSSSRISSRVREASERRFEISVGDFDLIGSI